MPTWFDTHCHLHLCEEDTSLREVIEDAAGAGVGEVVTVGIALDSSARAIEIARSHNGDGLKIHATAGVHPNDSAAWDDEMASAVELLAGQNEVVGVGESGLDFYRDSTPLEQQRRAFSAHIDIARRHDKALVVHTRDSVEAALDVLEAVGPPGRVVFHCWSGGADELERALALGAYVSFAGNVSFKSAEDLREAARAVPEDRLLVETDSPFLAPVPHRGRPNRPAFVVDVGAAVASTRGEDPAELAELTTANARTLFGLSP